MEIGLGTVFGTVVTTAASYGAPVVSSVSKKIWGTPDSPSSMPRKHHYLEPFSVLLEIAAVPLEDDDTQHKMKMNYKDTTMTRCPATPLGGLLRWWKGQDRTQAKELVDVAIRVIRWYDPNEDSQFGQSVRFIYEKAIEGLEIYRRTYSSGKDKKSDEAINAIMRAKIILEIKLSNEESDEGELGNRMVKELKERVKEELPKLIKDQENSEKELSRAGLWTESQSVWVIRDDKGNIEIDKLSPLVMLLQNLYKMKHKVEVVRTHKHLGSRFIADKESFEGSLEAKREEIKTMMN